MKLSTTARKLSAQRQLTRTDITTLAKQAARDGRITQAERRELSVIRDTMADKLDRGAKSALTRLLGNIPEDLSARGRAVDPNRVEALIHGDPRLGWRVESGRGAGESSGGHWSRSGAGE